MGHDHSNDHGNGEGDEYHADMAKAVLLYIYVPSLTWICVLALIVWLSRVRWNRCCMICCCSRKKISRSSDSEPVAGSSPGISPLTVETGADMGTESDNERIPVVDK